jgi:hypothetical protein
MVSLPVLLLPFVRSQKTIFLLALERLAAFMLYVGSQCL